MRRLLGIIVVLAVCILGVGVYRGWFEVSTGHTDDKSHITVTMDKEKVREDKQKGKEILEHAGEKLKEKAESLRDKH